MGIYYNRKNSPLSITLLDGTTYFFPGKKKTEVPATLESSPMLLRYLNKGHLHKEINLSFSEETVITEPTEIKLESQEVIDLPLTEKDEEVSDEIVEEEVKENTKRRKKLKE